MAEVGNMSLPSKLLKRGITDMVRIFGCAHERTAYGTVVLHVCPEAAAGGNLALVQEGDFIELDVESRRVHLDVSQEELEQRRERWQPPVYPMKSGYQQLYVERVMQADTGADLDFLDGFAAEMKSRASRIRSSVGGAARTCGFTSRSMDRKINGLDLASTAFPAPSTNVTSPLCDFGWLSASCFRFLPENLEIRRSLKEF